jgi:hypothetical protein
MISEAAVQQQMRLEASGYGVRLWRNNNGACKDENGRLIRYGLGNDSAKMNKHLKSSDLIGVTPVRITPEMVGQIVGIFTSIEVKREGWHYAGTEREAAQKAWIGIIKSFGGKGGFATNTGDLLQCLR